VVSGRDDLSPLLVHVGHPDAQVWVPHPVVTIERGPAAALLVLHELQAEAVESHTRGVDDRAGVVGQGVEPLAAGLEPALLELHADDVAVEGDGTVEVADREPHVVEHVRHAISFSRSVAYVETVPVARRKSKSHPSSACRTWATYNAS